jgi:hypothetical protein
MITALLVIVGVAMVLGSAIMLMGLVDAPEAYEDSEGFHLGQEPAISAHALLASPLTECHNDVAHAAFAQTQGQRHGALAAWPSVGIR